jgi:hypothetical protein
MRYFIVILLLFISTSSTTCLETYQFKIFPVGISNQQIITMDAQIHRTGGIPGWDGEKAIPVEISWIIKTYLSVYDEHQKLISSQLMETKVAKKDEYVKVLQASYTKVFQNIQKKYKGIENFQPYDISFCEYQTKCKMVEMNRNEKTNQDFINYKKKQYLINIIKDTTYYGFNKDPYFNDGLSNFPISSTRIYNTKSHELVVSHFETGHELSMGYITHDPNKKSTSENDVVIYLEEHKPNIPFNTIENAIYKEPLLHHGYGFDLFILHKKLK